MGAIIVGNTLIHALERFRPIDLYHLGSRAVRLWKNITSKA